MAIDAFYGAQDVSSHSDMQAAIAAYLKAMDAVIVPSDPVQEMVSAGVQSDELMSTDYVYQDMIAAVYRDMLAARPNHFTEE